MVAGQILDLFNEVGINIKDTDDYIGSFAAKVTYASGSLSVTWRPIDRVDLFRETGRPLAHEVGMNGDGSHYDGWYFVGEAR